MRSIDVAIVVSVLVLSASALSGCQFKFFPMPHNCIATLPGATKPLENPCHIVYNINTREESAGHMREIIKHYQEKTFFCNETFVNFASSTSMINPEEKSSFPVFVNITDPTLRSVFTIAQETYSINVTTQKAQLTAPTYAAFVHALQTFTQTVRCNHSHSRLSCQLENLPIMVTDDHPQFVYRGLMIDSARHFIPLHLILETIDAMMYNKMNVLHWHITDEDSFPLILDKHPEIAQYGSFSEEETYTTEDAREVVRYAMVRGVRVIPELDTPGHAASWGKAPQNKDIACTFGAGYMGPLDVTMKKTYDVLRDVLEELNSIFTDPIIHFGGDEVSLTCLKNNTEFTKQMQQAKFTLGHELYYRQKQRKIMHELNPSKRAMYWMNSQIHLDQQDVIHWWGGGLPDTDRKVVISNYGPYYLDMGVGNYFGVGYGSFITWMEFYSRNLQESIKNYKNKENVLGAEACLWSEISNYHTHHIKIWIRTSSLAERLWNSNMMSVKPDVLRRITAHERLMNRRGIPTHPATCQQCETHAEYC